MDLASSIIAVATVGIKVSTTLYSYSNGVVKAEKDITDIAADVALTSNVLNRVGGFMKQHAGLPVASDDAVRDVQSIITRCEAIFGEIDNDFRKWMRPNKDGSSQTVGIFGKATWPLRGKRVELLCRKLDGLKLSLLLLLEVLSLAVNIDAQQTRSTNFEGEREKIRQLYTRQQQSNVEEQSLIKEVERLGLSQAGYRALGNTHENKPSGSSSWSGPIPLPTQQMSLTQSHEQPINGLYGKSSHARQSPSFQDVESSEEEDGNLVPRLTASELECCLNDARKLLWKIEETHSFVLGSHPRQKRSRRRLRKAFFRFQVTFENTVVHGGLRSSPRVHYSGRPIPAEKLGHWQNTATIADLNPSTATSYGLVHPDPELISDKKAPKQHSGIEYGATLGWTSTGARPRTDHWPLTEDYPPPPTYQYTPHATKYGRPPRVQRLPSYSHHGRPSGGQPDRVPYACQPGAFYEEAPAPLLDDRSSQFEPRRTSQYSFSLGLGGKMGPAANGHDSTQPPLPNPPPPPSGSLYATPPPPSGYLYSAPPPPFAATYSNPPVQHESSSTPSSVNFSRKRRAEEAAPNPRPHPSSASESSEDLMYKRHEPSYGRPVLPQYMASTFGAPPRYRTAMKPAPGRVRMLPRVEASLDTSQQGKRIEPRPDLVLGYPNISLNDIRPSETRQDEMYEDRWRRPPDTSLAAAPQSMGSLPGDIVEQLLRKWTTLPQWAVAYNNPPNLPLQSS
ncbi:MAG: hypothetical protein M1822_006120 [Bathelium mastoideum]|nr:MAG: hypothetical protein M1822_006120 [Bathelium mastoideum]